MKKKKTIKSEKVRKFESGEFKNVNVYKSKLHFKCLRELRGIKLLRPLEWPNF